MIWAARIFSSQDLVQFFIFKLIHIFKQKTKQK